MDVPYTGKKRRSERGSASLTEGRFEVDRFGGASVPPEKRSFAVDGELDREAIPKSRCLSQMRRQGTG